MKRQHKAGSRTIPEGIILVAAISFAAVSLVSCVSVTPPGYVQKEWSAQIRELAIVPIFPPREDVQVGDVYILPRSPKELDALVDKKGYLPLGVWACQLDLNKNIQDFYSKRDSFPLTPTNLPAGVNGLTNNPFGLIDQASSTDSIFVNNGDTKRLRLVGFPQFMSASFTQGDLSALIPIEAVNLTLGTSFSDEKKVTVSIPVAESYALPAATIQPIFKEKEITPVASPAIPWANFFNLAPSEGKYTSASSHNRYVYGYAIYEVYYTRAIDISIQSERGSASRLNASVAGSQALNQAASLTNAAGQATNTPPAAPQMGDPIAAAQRLNATVATNMNKQLTPGGSLNFVSVSDGSVSMRRAYVRPVAIGFRAIVFTLDQYGNIAQQGSLSSSSGAMLMEEMQ